MEKLTDEILMAKVAAGDLDVLKTLYERHHKHVFNFLYKMSGDRIVSEDITQEVFYKLMKYRTSYNNGKFVSWLLTIARNSLNTHFRGSTHKIENLESIDHKLAISEEHQADYSDCVHPKHG